MTSFILQSINDRPPSFPSLSSSSSTSSTRASTNDTSSLQLLPHGDCTFCDIIAGYTDAWKVYEDEMVIAFLDIYPLREAHTLLVPKSHHARIADLPRDMGSALGSVMPSIVQAIGEAMGNRDLNVVCNQGYAQEVHHVHFHLIPAPVFEHEKPITSRSYKNVNRNVPSNSEISITSIDGIDGVDDKNEKIPSERSIISPSLATTTTSSSPTHGWMRKREMYKREELDDDRADELVHRIKSRL